MPTPSPHLSAAPVSASLFSVVLGLSGLGQAWRLAVPLWQMPAIIGEIVLGSAALAWALLLTRYIAHAMRRPALALHEFRHPVAGNASALLGVSTVLISQALLPYSRPLAWSLALGGIAWNIAFSIWHTGMLWQGGRQAEDAVPSIYLPTVAANLTSAGTLGALGMPDWGWLFLGIGMLSWLALEPLVIQRLWQGQSLPTAQRAMLGIQFAPPVVCACALLLVQPDVGPQWILMLLGYSLFQMLIGLRLAPWLGRQPFSYAWWAFSFGVVSATVACNRLALQRVPAAMALALPIFLAANVFIGYLCVKSLGVTCRARQRPPGAAGH